MKFSKIHLYRIIVELRWEFGLLFQLLDVDQSTAVVLHIAKNFAKNFKNYNSKRKHVDFGGDLDAGAFRTLD